MHTILTAADRAATARSASFVLRCFDLAHSIVADEMAAYGHPAPERFLAGDSPKDVGPAGESDDLVADEVEP